ncbi:hypothetical protein EVAR_17414_1 [Eumeta japonica]|uniref:Uncharacterized protein n=1 Tax=Eumeta variegata TaxID=151549 RepID=A0A4C1VA00_EUMVA|nr:hypothetical protein EVAR_17414_1 [Eumeta japonica]
MIVALGLYRPLPRRAASRPLLGPGAVRRPACSRRHETRRADGRVVLLGTYDFVSHIAPAESFHAFELGPSFARCRVLKGSRRRGFAAPRLDLHSSGLFHSSGHDFDGEREYAKSSTLTIVAALLAVVDRGS